MTKSDRIMVRPFATVQPRMSASEIIDHVDHRYEIGEEIDDAAALTIASWYASEGWGEAFRELVLTGTTSALALSEAISDVYGRTTSSRDKRELDMLSTWAINHASRQ